MTARTAEGASESPPKRKRRLPRQLKSTREGKAVIFITLGLGFGAVNSGNNLLYLILGMLLSLIIVSGVLSEYSVQKVTVRRRHGGGFHAGSPTLLPVEVVNDKTRLSSFSLEVEERLISGARVDQKAAHVLLVGPGERVDSAIWVTALRRGVYASEGIRVATHFPFGFFRKSRLVDDPGELVVWPEVRRVGMPPSITAGLYGADPDPHRVGRGEEYHGLREHRHEDDRRDIHWKSSARLGRLVVREWEAPATRRVWLHLPSVVESDAGAEALEMAVIHTASLSSQLLGVGYSVGLRTHDGTVALGAGAAHLPAILNHLARLVVRRDGSALTPTGERGDRLLVRYAGMAGSVDVDRAVDAEPLAAAGATHAV